MPLPWSRTPYALALVSLLSCTHAFPLLYGVTGNVSLTSALGANVTLQPAAGGAQQLQSLAHAQQAQEHSRARFTQAASTAL